MFSQDISPYTPLRFARAYNQNSIVLTPPTAQILPLDVVSYDSTGNMVDLTNNRIDIDIDGVYYAKMQCLFQSTASRQVLNMRIKRNTSFRMVEEQVKTPATNGATIMGCHAVGWMKAGDFVQMEVANLSITATAGGSVAEQSFLEVFLVRFAPHPASPHPGFG